MVTDWGTVAMVLSVLARLTSRPPAGAGELSETPNPPRCMPAATLPPDRPVMAGAGPTLTVILPAVTPVADAVSVVVPALPPLAVAIPEVAPAAMFSGLLTVPRFESTVLSVIASPPGGAGSDSTTSNCTLPDGGTSTLGGRIIAFCRTGTEALAG